MQVLTYACSRYHACIDFIYFGTRSYVDPASRSIAIIYRDNEHRCNDDMKGMPLLVQTHPCLSSFLTLLMGMQQIIYFNLPGVAYSLWAP